MTRLSDVLARAAMRLFPAPGKPVIAAVSGGADSCALLDVLVCNQRWPVILCHLDHGLRAESVADAALLRQRVAAYRSEGYEVSEEYHRVDVASMARDLGIGWEEAGRKARYALLTEVAARYRAEVVATAHHRDDQAETILANILRGSGPVGMCGIPETRPLNQACRVVRPLLAVSHADCCAHLEERGLTWNEDASNRDPRFFRNRIRHEILPSFEAGCPGFVTALLDFSRSQRAHIEGLVADAAGMFLRFRKEDSIELDAILRVSEATRRMVWRRLANELRLPMNRGVLARLEDLAQGRSGRKYEIAEYTFTRRPQAMSWEQLGPTICPLTRPLLVPGQTAVYGGAIHADWYAPHADVIAGPHEAFICLDDIEGALCWRFPFEGERWHPFGGEGSRTVLRYLADRQVRPHARRRQVVVADARGVIWIPGCTISDRVRVHIHSKRIVHLRYYPEEGKNQLH